MTMPGKGRRSITVNSLRYHYLIAFERSERVLIRSADGNGSFLFVFPFAIMKPSHIAAAIRYGISCGWMPTQKAHNCWLAFDVDANDVAHFEHIPLDDFRVVTYPSMGKLDGCGFEFPDTRPWYDRPSPADRL